MTSDVTKIDEQIKDLEHKISITRAEIDPSRVSVFRYFWPFLVVSIVLCFFACIYSFVYFFSTPPDERVFSQTVVYFAILVVFMLIHVTGGVFSRYRMEKKNRELQTEEDNLKFEIRKLDVELSDLKLRKMSLTMEESGGAALQAGGVASVSDGAAGEPDEGVFAPAANPFDPQYNTMSPIDEEIKVLNAKRMELLNAPPVVRRGSFKYFWPFMIISFAAFQGTRVILSMFVYSSFWEGSGLDSQFMMFMIPGSVFAMIHIFAGIYARKKRDDYNQKADETENTRNIEEAKLRERIAELEYKKMQMLEKVNASQA